MNIQEILKGFAAKETAGKRSYSIDENNKITIMARKYVISDEDTGETSFTMVPVLTTSAAELRIIEADAQATKNAINAFLTLKGL